MYILKGFLSFPTLTNNTVGEVAPLGEISKDSLTYAKETGLYKTNTYPNVLLHAFESRDEDSGVIEVPQTYRDTILHLGHWALHFAMSGRMNDSRARAVQEFENEFQGTIQDIVVGEMRTDGDIWLPEWISFSLEEGGDYIRLWMADNAFSAQYDNFEYEFIPPVGFIDDFFRPRDQIVGLLMENGFKRLTERVEETRGENPFTIIRTEEYSWVNPNRDNDELTTGWTVLIYGRAGNDPDQIRLALIEWILNNTARTRQEWLEIFPDIFTPTEFILTPLWHQYAIPNQTIQSGINSPNITLRRAHQIATRLCLGIGYESEDLWDNTVVASTPLRSLGFLATGSAANRNTVSNLKDLYPDYIGLPLASPDFARLSVKTQDWAMMLIELIKVAETMTSFTIIPSGYARIIREDVVYAVKDFDGMQYLMVTRDSAIKTLGVETPYVPEFEEEDPYQSIEARIIREHLIYEQDPHRVSKEQLGLADISNAELLTLEDAVLEMDTVEIGT